MSRDRGPILWIAGAVCWLLAVGLLTLAPRTADAPAGWIWCLLCGTRGTADFCLNVVLFLPLGLLIGLGRRSLAAAAGAALAISLGVELAQLAIPGRISSAGDLVANTTGGALGWGLARTPGLLRRGGPPLRRAARATLGLVAVLLAAPVALLQPSFPDSVPYGQWTPELGHLATYDGSVLEARLGTMPLPGRRLPDPAGVRSLLRRGARPEVRFVVGRHRGDLAPVFSIFDDRQREILLLGVEHEDLVYRVRTRAAALGLEAPAVRWRGAMARFAPGDTITVRLDRSEGADCVRIGRERTCRRLARAEAGWTLFIPAGRASRLREALLGAAWLFALSLPLGLLTTGVPRRTAALALPAAFLIVLAPPVAGTGAALLGLLAGLVVGGRAASRLRRSARAGTQARRTSSST